MPNLSVRKPKINHTKGNGKYTSISQDGKKTITKICQQTVGKINTNKNGGFNPIIIRSDHNGQGLLMGNYPKNRKYITGLVQTCRANSISFVIEDKPTVLNLAQRQIILNKNEISKSLLKDPEIINLISK